MPKLGEYYKLIACMSRLILIKALKKSILQNMGAFNNKLFPQSNYKVVTLLKRVNCRTLFDHNGLVI